MLRDDERWNVAADARGYSGKRLRRKTQTPHVVEGEENRRRVRAAAAKPAPAAAVKPADRSHDESSYAEPGKVVIKALALDLKELLTAYEAGPAVAVDLFPQTMHIETIVELKKKP